MNRKQTGKLGEDIACDYLKNKGYKILQRNFERKISQFLKSEIDIIAKKQDAIHFIEVKAQKVGRATSNCWFLPEDKVDYKKQRKIIKTAELWLSKNKIPLDSKWQIDIISIKISPDPDGTEINHFENAVSL